VRRREGLLVVRVVNDTRVPVARVVERGWWKLDGEMRDIHSDRVQVPANGMVEVAAEPVASARERDPRLWLYGAVLREEEGACVDQSVWPLLPHRELALAHPRIDWTSSVDGRLEISSPVFCHGVHVEDHGREVISDNWFDLLPGVPVRVQLAKGHSPDELRFESIGGGALRGPAPR
jgi:hypothetical protein